MHRVYDFAHGSGASELRETMTEFLLESGRERTERRLADRARFRLDNQSWRALEAALDRPTEVKPQLAELFARSRPE